MLSPTLEGQGTRKIVYLDDLSYKILSHRNSSVRLGYNTCEQVLNPVSMYHDFTIEDLLGPMEGDVSAIRLQPRYVHRFYGFSSCI
jgi:hypothetical protein